MHSRRKEDQPIIAPDLGRELYDFFDFHQDDFVAFLPEKAELVSHTHGAFPNQIAQLFQALGKLGSTVISSLNMRDSPFLMDDEHAGNKAVQDFQSEMIQAAKLLDKALTLFIRDKQAPVQPNLQADTVVSDVEAVDRIPHLSSEQETSALLVQEAHQFRNQLREQVGQAFGLAKLASPLSDPESAPAVWR